MGKAIDLAAAVDGRAGSKLSERLKVNEIFYSLQGEARSVGWPTVFVRLTGCPLRCTYCDTEYAFSGGQWMSSEDILAAVADHRPRFVTVTGGEPLAQKNCRPLLSRLCDVGYDVSLETSGALDIGTIDSRVTRVMDVKTPGSGESHRMLIANFDVLEIRDQVKFVIADRADYLWSRSLVLERQLDTRCEVLFSPSHDEQPPGELADWILADHLPVRFQVQLHKYLWGDVPGR